MFNKNNIRDVRFSNSDEDVIAVVYEDENGDNVETYVSVNKTDASYKLLVKAGYSAEVVKEKTTEAKRAYMQNVYETLRTQHKPQFDKMLADLKADYENQLGYINADHENRLGCINAEHKILYDNVVQDYLRYKEDKERDIARLDNTIKLRKDQFMLSSAALNAIIEVKKAEYAAINSDISNSVITPGHLFKFFGTISNNDDLLFKLKVQSLKFDEIKSNKDVKQAIRKAKNIEEVVFILTSNKVDISKYSE